MLPADNVFLQKGWCIIEVAILEVVEGGRLHNIIELDSAAVQVPRGFPAQSMDDALRKIRALQAINAGIIQRIKSLANGKRTWFTYQETWAGCE